LSTVQNKAVLLRAIDQFNDPSQRTSYFDLYSAHAVLHGYSGVEPGIESIKSFYIAFWSAFPNASVTIDHLMAEGSQVACCFTITGTHTGEYLGIRATGREVSFTGITILRFVDGRCVERWSQADSVGLLRQLGALP
jgi:predicted ester cyclase